MSPDILLSQLTPLDRGWVSSAEDERLEAYVQTLPDETQERLARGGAAVTFRVDADGRRIRLCWFGDAPGLGLAYAVVGGQSAPDQSA